MELFKEDLFSHLKKLNPEVFKIGVSIRKPLDDDKAMDGLETIAKNFPALSSKSYDEENKTFALEDEEANIIMRLMDSTVLDLSWQYSSYPGTQFIEDIFDTAQRGFGIRSINIDLVHSLFLVTSSWEGNHYTVIYDAFLQNTPFSHLIKQGDKILQDDIFIRWLIDETRIGILGIDSNVLDREIIKGRFNDDLLRAYLGIAEINIPDESHLSTLFLELINTFEDFIRNIFIPIVLEPLDTALVKHSS